MPYITTKSTISSITTAKGCTAAAATAISTLITSFHCSRYDFWIIHCYTSFEKSWSIMAAVLRFSEGHQCHGWSHQGITGSSSECQTSSPCDWQIPSDKMEEVVDACMALWTVSSSSSLMSWVALTASPGHGMYMTFPQLLLMDISNHEHSQLRETWLGWKRLPCSTMSSWTRKQMIKENPTC